MYKQGKHRPTDKPDECNSSAGNNALLDGGPRGVEGVGHAVLLLSNLNLARSSDLRDLYYNKTLKRKIFFKPNTMKEIICSISQNIFHGMGQS